MSDLSVDILSGLTVIVATTAIVLVITTSIRGVGRPGGNYDLGLLLGISWVIGGLAAANLAVGIIGGIVLLGSLVMRRRRKKSRE
ncbi:MAG: hypothetical protein R6U89_00440 [Dehalococcoidia bacterium]